MAFPHAAQRSFRTGAGAIGPLGYITERAIRAIGRRPDQPASP
jgi:hypothetical protein